MQRLFVRPIRYDPKRRKPPPGKESADEDVGAPSKDFSYHTGRIWSAGLCTALVRTTLEFRHAKVVRTPHSL